MTSRLLYPTYWASGGDATDPDLDTTAPSYEPDKYATKGWHSEKPPEEWQNFLTQITDEKIINTLIQTFQLWESTITYPAGAIVRDDTNVYKNISGADALNKALTDATVWSKVVELKGAEYAALVAGLRKQITDHLAADNPHQDTIHNIGGGGLNGGYEKAEFSVMFSSATDPKTIVYHKLQMGQVVHKETPAQLGTLPVAGGTFTGAVIFATGVYSVAAKSKGVHYNNSTALTELFLGSVSLGANSLGSGFYVTTTTGSSLVLTEANYQDMQISVNNSFALPVPIVSCNMKMSLGEGNSVGYWILETANNPVFDLSRGLKIVDNPTTLTFNGTPAPVTVVIYATQPSGTQKAFIKDFSSWSMHTNTSMLQSILTNSFGQTDDAEYMSLYVVYPTLTDRQKSMLVK